MIIAEKLRRGQNCCNLVAIDHLVVPSPDPITLNCALVRYLAETSRQERGSEPEFAAAMLADMGYFNASRAGPNVANLKDYLDILITAEYRDTMATMTGHCKSCPLSNECVVGGNILKL